MKLEPKRDVSFVENMEYYIVQNGRRAVGWDGKGDIRQRLNSKVQQNAQVAVLITMKVSMLQF